MAAEICSYEYMRPSRLQNALASLGDAMSEVNAAIEEMRSEHDPLASHIFVSRRVYQAKSDTKSGKRHHLSARLSPRLHHSPRAREMPRKQQEYY